MALNCNCSRAGILKFLKKQALLLATIASVVLGIVLGVAMRFANLSKLDITYFSFPGTLFVRMLKMVIVPIIICSLITAVSTIPKTAASKLGGRAVVYYFATTLISVIIGIVLVVSINPGGRFAQNRSGSLRKAEPVDTLLDLVRNLFPTNIVAATFSQEFSSRVPITSKMNVSTVVENPDTAGNFRVNSTAVPEEVTKWTEEDVAVDYKVALQSKSGINALGLIVFCLTFGLIIGQMGKPGRVLVKFFAAANEAILRMVWIIIWYGPIGIMFLIASKIMDMNNPQEELARFGLYMVTVIAGLIIHAFIVLPVIYFVVIRSNPFSYMLGALQAMLTALATSSSSATLPITITCAEKNNKVDSRAARFVLPIGATINMDGTALYEAVAAIFIAQSVNISLNFGQILAVSITATAASIGAAGVPQAGLVTLIIVLSAIGLPADDIQLILAIDWLLDRFRTSVNVWGDSVGAAVVAHLLREDFVRMDEEKNSVREDKEDDGGLSNHIFQPDNADPEEISSV
uniref:Amino acid transporter n=1 Tax=Phallusia mammillata TaxID=59560 RepID=A0A6F9DSY9_9ASCI|nr:excitatory amino acid transporter 3-like [Phallusia mammillata]